MISVIIPNYDDNEVISRAIESVRATKPETEIIVVDNTAELETAVSVTVLEEPPQPAGHNRNAGLDVAHGEYIQFLDADDRLLSLHDRLKKLENTSATVAVGQTKYVGENTRVEPLGQSHPNPATQYLRHQFNPTIGGILCHRSVFENTRFWEGMDRAQDWHLWVRVLHDEPITTVNQPAFAYIQSENQQSKQNIHERYANQRKGCRELWLSYPELRRELEYWWRWTWKAELRWFATRFRQSIPRVRGGQIGSQNTGCDKSD